MSSKIKRVLILGHTGFIGKHLVKFFKKTQPEVELIGKSIPEVDLTNIEDAKKLSNSLDGDTTVIMCAAIKRQFGDNLDNFSKNVKMVENLSRVLEERPVKRLIFFSSAAVYGEDIHNINITENTSICPTSYYGIAKYTCERLLIKSFNNIQGGSLFIVRPPLIYGSGDPGSTYGPAGFVKAALRKEKITLWGDGSELREFIFVEDIAKIIHQLTFSEQEGIVNISSGKSTSFKDILGIISNFVNEQLTVDSRQRTKDKVDNVFCNNQFMNLLGNFQFTNLRDGIKKTIDVEKSAYLSSVGSN